MGRSRKSSPAQLAARVRPGRRAAEPALHRAPSTSLLHFLGLGASTFPARPWAPGRQQGMPRVWAVLANLPQLAVPPGGRTGAGAAPSPLGSCGSLFGDAGGSLERSSCTGHSCSLPQGCQIQLGQQQPLVPEPQEPPCWFPKHQ